MTSLFNISSAEVMGLAKVFLFQTVNICSLCQHRVCRYLKAFLGLHAACPTAASTCFSGIPLASPSELMWWSCVPAFQYLRVKKLACFYDQLKSLFFRSVCNNIWASGPNRWKEGMTQSFQWLLISIGGDWNNPGSFFFRTASLGFCTLALRNPLHHFHF